MQLYKAIGTTDTTITVINSSNLSPSQPGTIQIESEVIHYQSCDPNNFFGCTRGYNSTSAASHAAGVAVTFLASDSPSGEGTLGATAPVVVTGDISSGATVSIPKATGSVDGYLNHSDFTTFNGKQAALGFTPENVANKDTTTTLGTSDTKYPSQNAVKTYADTKVPSTRQVAGHALSADVTLAASDVGLGNVTNDAQVKASQLDTDGTLAANSDTRVATQKATKTYVDAHAGGGTTPNVVQATNSTVDFFTTTSSTFVDIGFGVTITPSSSSAKIRLSLVLQEAHLGSAVTAITIKRGIGGTDLSGGNTNGLTSRTPVSGSNDMYVVEWLDSPATTSPITYEVYVRTDGGTFRMNDGGSISVLIAQEVH